MGAAAVSFADVGGLLEDAPYGAPGPLLLLIGIGHDLRCLPPHDDEAEPGSKPSCEVILRMARLRAEESRELGCVEGLRSPYLQKSWSLGSELICLSTLYPTATTLELFDEQELVDVLTARQPVRSGNQDHVELGHRRRVMQLALAGTVQSCATVTFIQVNVLFLKQPTLPFGVAFQAR
jgi:hypothetical protein